jgi:hypothetical protein
MIMIPHTKMKISIFDSTHQQKEKKTVIKKLLFYTFQSIILIFLLTAERVDELINRY